MILIFNDGMPPDHDPGQFIGVDENGNAYIIRWHGPDGWVAIGTESDPVYDWRPVTAWGKAAVATIVQTARLTND